MANYQRTQKLLVKSRFVLNAALKDPGVARLEVVREQLDPVEWLDRTLAVEFPAPGVMSISLQGKEPEALEKIVNAVVRTYRDELLDKEERRRRELLGRLSKALEYYQDRLRDAREKHQGLARQAGSSDPRDLGFKYRLALEHLMNAEADRRQVEFDLMRLEAETDAATQADRRGKTAEGGIPAALIDEQIRKHPDVRQLLDRRAQLQNQIRDTQRLLAEGREGPFLVRFRQELQSVDDALAARQRELRPEAEAGLRKELAARTRTHTDQLRQEVAAKKALRDKLDALIQDLTRKSRGITDYSLELDSLKKQITDYEGMTTWFSNKVEQLRWEQQGPSRVELLEEAYTTQTLDAKKQALAAGLAGAAALCLGLFGVAWREQRTRRVKSGDEVMQRIGLRLVGSLPRLPAAAGRTADAAGFTVEHIDAARARLLYTARVEPFRTLMVTSAVAGEGKTSVACHLALSLARAGRKVLLLDADLRRPSAHRPFNLAAGPGFCEVLRGEADLASVVQSTLWPDLALIPGGRWDPEASQALAQEERVRGLLRRLGESYDFVILDSSPVLAVADALWLAQYVDAALFAVLYDVSHLPAVQAAYGELASVGTRILGAVLGGAPAKRSSYYAGYYAAPAYGSQAPSSPEG